MPKVESRFVTLTHPISRRCMAELPDLFGFLEFQEFMRHRELPEGTQIEVDGQAITAGGSRQIIEFRKTLDYSRAERRAAKQSGQVLQFNQFKGVLPTGYTPVPHDDPRLKSPAPDAPQGA